MNTGDQVQTTVAKREATRPRRPKALTDNTVKKLRNLKSFKPGTEWKGNAKGRPPGARNRLCAQYIDDLQTVWAEQGIAAIRAAAKKRPVAFINAIGALVPREYDLGDNTQSSMADALMAIWRAQGGISSIPQD